MSRSGILSEDERVELIGGQIIVMSPSSPPHSAALNVLAAVLGRQLESGRHLRGQSPVQLDGQNLPEPDLAIVKAKADHYASQHPGPADILLLVEVSRSSVKYDREVKAGIYAAAGIPEYWMVVPDLAVVEVFRRPSGDRYLEQLTICKQQALTTPMAPEVHIPLADLFA